MVGRFVVEASVDFALFQMHRVVDPGVLGVKIGDPILVGGAWIDLSEPLEVR